MCLCGTCLAITLLVLYVSVAPIPFAQPKCKLDEVGACKHAHGAVTVDCNDGVFVGLVRQPDLALRHFDVRGVIKFASSADRDVDCNVTYSLSCGKVIMVHEARVCYPSQMHYDPPPVALGHTWEVCATPQIKLRVELPVIDLSSHIQQEAALVEGCVQVSAPGRLPDLAAVRGSVNEQISALTARAKAVGGCPVWNSMEDQISRGTDFSKKYSWFFSFAARNYMQLMSEVAAEWKNKPPQLESPGLKHALVFFGLMLSGGFDSLLSFMGKVTCGQPVVPPIPSVGMGIYRYQEVAQLATDPQQVRTYSYGLGVSELCFDSTMSIFLSTGSPEYVQTRKLWDLAGLSSAHFQNLPPIPEFGLPSWKQHVKNAIGIRAPLRQEIDMVVVSLFMEILWRKKPTTDQLLLFTDYLTYGSFCIHGQILEKLPLIPSKLEKIRKEVVDFAKTSPLGKAIDGLLKQPKFAELRALYEGRGHASIDMALLNLADASMYFGLIGTAKMTAQCIDNLWMSPHHKRLFQRNATTYLWELMRVKPASAGLHVASKNQWRMHMAGEYIQVPVGGPIFVGISASGFDESVFENPHQFNPQRPNLEEMMTWNGKIKDVSARDYSSAPRFCPGYALSVRLASYICEHLTQKVPS